MTPEDAVRVLLRAVGEDPSREGLEETPKRVVKMLTEMRRAESFSFTTFSSEGVDEMIVQDGIPVRSLCEHHLLPFMGTAVVAYLPNQKIVGLSKLSRAVDHCARGLQNQERITLNVANMVQEALNPKGVAVMIRARHTCMEVRGPKASGAVTTTSCLLGRFKEDPATRAEFMSIAHGALSCR